MRLPSRTPLLALFAAASCAVALAGSPVCAVDDASRAGAVDQQPPRPRPTWPGMPGQPQPFPTQPSPFPSQPGTQPTQPGTQPQPPAPQPQPSTPVGPIPGVANYLGIVKLMGCSGALVRFPTSKGSDKAMVLTNGHCVDAKDEPNTFIVDKADKRNYTLLDASGKGDLGKVKGEKYLYASQSGTDVGLMQVSETYDALKSKYNVPAITLATRTVTVGETYMVTSGDKREMYQCRVEKNNIYRMREDPSVWADSISYAKNSACSPTHGTSGSPVINRTTGEIQAIANTGNDKGEKCTLNNPCEIDSSGKITVNQNVKYAQQTWWLTTCVDANGVFSLKNPGCHLTGGTNPPDLTLPKG